MPMGAPACASAFLAPSYLVSRAAHNLGMLGGSSATHTWVLASLLHNETAAALAQPQHAHLRPLMQGCIGTKYHVVSATARSVVVSCTLAQEWSEITYALYHACQNATELCRENGRFVEAIPNAFDALYTIAKAAGSFIAQGEPHLAFDYDVRVCCSLFCIIISGTGYA